MPKTKTGRAKTAAERQAAYREKVQMAFSYFDDLMDEFVMACDRGRSWKFVEHLPDGRRPRAEALTKRLKAARVIVAGLEAGTVAATLNTVSGPGVPQEVKSKQVRAKLPSYETLQKMTRGEYEAFRRKTRLARKRVKVVG